MIKLRKSQDRGHFDHGWLNTSHTFSFDRYYDPAHMAFRSLRVINEDHVEPGHGFPTHSHRDMEIITYILEGELEHKDSMGTGSVIRPGDLQRMSAGTGVAHSEYNPSDDFKVHLLQIWILPESEGLKPSYEQINFAPEELRGKLRLIASPDGHGGSVTIHQDARVYATTLELNETVTHELAPNRYAWLQVARGALKLNDNYMRQGDGAAVDNESLLTVIGTEPAEALLFDLA